MAAAQPGTARGTTRLEQCSPTTVVFPTQDLLRRPDVKRRAQHRWEWGAFVSRQGDSELTEAFDNRHQPVIKLQWPTPADR